VSDEHLMRILLRNTRTTDTLRHGGMGELFARWRRACAACVLLRNTRTTDTLRHGGMGELLARWRRACAACVLLSIVFAAAGLAAEPEAVALPRHILTNDGLVVLARAGVGDSLLVDLVRNKRTVFDTSADALALLARHGLSENVLRAVVEKQEQVQLRRPRLTVRPMTEPGEPDMDAGHILVVAAPGARRGKAEPDRWYRVSMR